MRTLLDTSYELLSESNDRLKQTFCASVLLGQVGHNIMITNWQVLMESLSNKDATSDDTGASVLGQGFVFLAVATSFDFLGSSFGGYLVKCGCPVGKLLPLSMAFRFLTTAICWIYYLISYTHTPYLLLFAAFIAIDFFFVGVLDSSRSILVVLLEPDSSKRKVFNSNIEACFQVGNVLGPLVGAIILTATNGSLSLALPLPPSFFLIVAVLYMNFSRFSQSSVSDTFATTKRPNNNYLPKVVLFLISGCLQLNRMKSILPSVMVHLGEGDNPVWAIGWITACFGIGNTVGSYVSRHVPSEWSSYALLSGALSTLLFALFPVLQNIYQVAVVVFFANILVGIAFVQLNVEIQQLFSDKLWLIGVNRAYMRFCLLVQKVIISLALSGALSSMGSSLDLLSGMFSILTAIQLILGIIRLKMKYNFNKLLRLHNLFLVFNIDQITLRQLSPSAQQQQPQPVMISEDVDRNRPIKFSWPLYWILFLFGIGMLFPWNVFITCRSYLSSRLQGSQYADNFSNFFSIGFMISNFVVLFYIQFMPSAQGGGVRQLLRRIMISFLINACVFVVCLILASVNTGKDFAYAFFYINIVLVVTCGTSTAFLQNAVFGLVSSVFPGVYMQAVMSGQGLAACLVALSQMINSLLDSGENAVMYFSFAVFVIGVCVASGALLPNLHSFKEYSKLHSASSSVSKDSETASKNDQEEEALFDPELEETFDLDRTTFVTSSQKLWFVMSKIKLSAAAVFITFFVTLSLFPSVLNLMRSSYGGSSEAETRWREELFLPLAFLSFAISDWIGKSMPGVKLFVDFGALKSPVVILVCSVLRVAFIPLFLVCNVVIMDPVTMDPLPRVFLNTLITNDYFVLIIVFVFGLTNGYLSSLAMMHAPNLITENGSSYEQLGVLTKDNEAELKQLAGTAMVFCLTFGLTVGSFFSFALRSALCGFCDPFVN